MIRAAMVLAMAGLTGVLPLLLLGFSAPTMALALALGFPCLALATLLYGVIVVLDLHRNRLI